MPKPSRRDEYEYEQMLLLEQLESLREEMEELGVSTLAEVEAKIAALHGQLDEHDDQA